MKKLMIIMLAVLLVGCSTNTTKPKENQTLRESIQWKDNSKKIKEFKTYAIQSYPDMPLQEAIKDKNEKWKYGKEDKVKYLMCSFKEDDVKNCIIFYQDQYENVNIAEYYKNNKKQNKKVIKQFEETYFVKKEEPVQEKTFETQDYSTKNTTQENKTQEPTQTNSIKGTFDANFMPPEGEYYNSSDGGWPNMCEIIIKHTSSNSFSFVIYRVFDNNGNSCNEKIFNEHEAVFESFDARSAVFRGNQYTIYFYCNYFNSFNINGFAPAEEAGDLYSTGGSDSFGY